MSKFVDYQKVRAFHVKVTPEAQGAGNEVVIDIPAGSIVSVKAAVATVFDGTSPTITVADTTGRTYVNAADAATVGIKGSADGYLKADGSVTVSIGGSGSTAGEAYVQVVYTNEELSDGTWSNDG